MGVYVTNIAATHIMYYLDKNIGIDINIKDRSTFKTLLLGVHQGLG